MRSVVLLVVFISALYSSTALNINKGWQLIGLSKNITDMSVFTEDNVEVLWAYDSLSKSWLGYSEDSSIKSRISNGGYSEISEIKKYHGIWIKSKKDWTLSLEKDEVAVDYSRDDNVSLIDGWNLISLPLNSVVSPKIFGDVTMWKYGEDSWEFRDNNATSDDFPNIEKIGNSDGLWIYSDENKTVNISDEEGKLVNFATIDEVQEYVENIYLTNARPYYGIYELDYATTSFDDMLDTALPTMESDSGESASGSDEKVTDTTNTNLQEVDVDEADVLKHDGENIYFVDSSEKVLYFTSFLKMVNGDFNQTGTVAIDSKYSVNSMHIDGNSLIVLYNSNYTENGQSFLVESFDINDSNSITKQGSYKVDGYLVSSRVVDNKLYLITTFYPTIEYSYPKNYLDAVDSRCKDYFSTFIYDLYVAECYNLNYDKESGKYYRYDYSNPTISSKKLLPEISNSIDNSTVNYISPQKFYAPLKLNQTANISSVLKLNTHNLVLEDSTVIVGNIDTVYASTRSIYVVSSGYGMFFDFWNSQQRTGIYKFSIEDELNYKGRGFVDGTIVNQFSLSEYNDYLRIATTKGFSWISSGTDNMITTLKEVDGELKVFGELKGLGKEGETIKAVRFVGDKGFVVTFRTTDPLYTIDLSNPESPSKIGELEITGFSEYFHPIDENRIMSIGREADSLGVRAGLMVELFDISDFSNPVLADKKIIGTSSTHSEAEYNHKAFIYRESDMKFAFPVSDYASTAVDSIWYYGYENYFKLFYINNYSIEEIGNLRQTENSENYYGNSRGIIFTYEGDDYGAYFNGSNFIAKKIDEISGD